MKIIECVPNFSEGRDKQKIHLITQALATVSGVKLLDCCMDRDHHRTVLTFLGSPEDVLQGALAACNQAIRIIDMREHAGVHPRIGSVDVVPFIPLEGASMADAVAIAHRFGSALGMQNQLPVYYYGEAAFIPDRKELPKIRRGGYEGLNERIKHAEWQPDAGPCVFNARSGATAVGVRMPLIAFNINLNSSNLDLAREIAKTIRESCGGLRCVRAIGVFLKSRHIAQVSMNLTNYRITSIRTVFEKVRELADREGIDILESEVIGLVPRAAMEGFTPEELKLNGFTEEKIIETHVAIS